VPEKAYAYFECNGLIIREKIKNEKMWWEEKPSADTGRFNITAIYDGTHRGICVHQVIKDVTFCQKCILKSRAYIFFNVKCEPDLHDRVFHSFR